MATWWDGLKGITALVMIAALADLLMPTGSMRRYARLATGLLLVLMILQPLLALILGQLPAELSLQTILQETEGRVWP